MRECCTQHKGPADPVCGVDGLTYARSCLAACQGVAVRSGGPCLPDDLKLLDPGALSAVPESTIKRFASHGYRCGCACREWCAGERVCEFLCVFVENCHTFTHLTWHVLKARAQVFGQRQAGSWAAIPARCPSRRCWTQAWVRMGVCGVAVTAIDTT